MVGTHLPSNLLLAAVAFAPAFAPAAVLLLARTTLSQMDVPTRQALVMNVVAPGERWPGIRNRYDRLTGGVAVIACLRTVVVPAEWRERYLAWIGAGRAIRQEHGILAELVCEPAIPDGDTVVITVWPSHEVFGAWIATPHRDARTNSEVHRAVSYAA